VFALKQPDRTDDAALIEAVLRGEEDAFAALVTRYQDRIHRLLARLCRDSGETEDLAQEVFVKVYRKLHTFQHDASFYTWVYRIAVNTATDHLTRARRRRLHLVEDPGTLDDGERASDDAGSAQPVLDAELRDVTRALLDRLPEKYRTILVLREYEDLSYTEIAQVLQCSIGTVESRLFRARQRFKDALERRHPELVPGLRGGSR
jgi:RNA polymerase sigma-70 factor (ECF subfamily)